MSKFSTYKKRVGATISRGEMIEINIQLSIRDKIYFLRKFPTKQNKNNDKGSPCRTPPLKEKQPLGKPLIRIEILSKEKRS